MTDARASTDRSYDCVATTRQQPGANAHHGHGHGHAHDRDHSHHHGQAFDHGAHVHHRDHAGGDVTTALKWALVITAIFMVAEVVGGIVSNSLTLLADAGHMLTDVAALGFSLFVAWLSRQPATPKRTYGYLRFEILAALLNGGTLLAVSGWIVWEAISRLKNPPQVGTGVMFVVAMGGVIVNIVAARLLHGSADHSLNVRGAYLHVLSDLLGSVAAVLAAVLMHYFGWQLADPIASILMTVLIVRSSWGLVRESVDILLESTPAHIDVTEVRRKLEEIDDVESVHDLHVWTLTSGVVAMSAHAVVREAAVHQRALEAMTACAGSMGIHHTTIQLEKKALADCPPDAVVVVQSP